MTRPAAISKNEAMTQMTQEVENWLEKAIPIINKELQNFGSGTHRTVYDAKIGLDSLSGDAKSRAITEIKAIYGTAVLGWKVTHEYGGQRDPGGWFTFS